MTFVSKAARFLHTGSAACLRLAFAVCFINRARVGVVAGGAAAFLAGEAEVFRLLRLTTQEPHWPAGVTNTGVPQVSIPAPHVGLIEADVVDPRGG